MQQLFREMPASKRPLTDKAIIGMIHLAPLPGSHRFAGSVQAIIDRAVEELEIYEGEGIDAVMIENMFDAPYLKNYLQKSTLITVQEIASNLRRKTSLPIGIQLLEAANLDALRIAKESDLDFIRVEGFAYGHLGGAGYIDACAGPLLQQRRELDAEHIKILADIKKKHCSHAVTADLSVGLVAKQAEWFCADSLVVTGDFTGEAVAWEDVREVANATHLSIFLGSGVTNHNIRRFMQEPKVKGFIVGTFF